MLEKDKTENYFKKVTLRNHKMPKSSSKMPRGETESWEKSILSEDLIICLYNFILNYNEAIDIREP